MEVMVPSPTIKTLMTEVAGEVVPELRVEGVMLKEGMAVLQA
jgi:hypothetical protein